MGSGNPPQEGDRKEPRKRGQRGKLDRETVDAILEAARNGASAKDAAAAAGVDRSTLYRWLELADGAEPPEPGELALEGPPELEANEVEDPRSVDARGARNAELERDHLQAVQDRERWLLACDLSDGLEKNRAAAKVDALRKIREAWESGTWQAGAWFLERTYPEEYSRRVLEIGGSESSGPVRVAIDRNALEEVLKRPELLMAAQESAVSDLRATPAGAALLGDQP